MGSFAAPMFVASPPRDTHRLFVVQRGGTVRVVRDGRVLPTPFLDISPEVATDGERGLLSIAFAPDYATSGRFYVYMVAAEPLGELQVREYRRSAANPDVAGLAGRIVWSQPHDEAANHNGGTLDFGPDGMLWFATGDGGGSDNGFGHARDLGSQLGKLLRIDPRPGSGGGDYTVPAENPYGTAIWAYGLRNPFRFSFDTRGTRDLFIGDVGQGTREEIDRLQWAARFSGGADFGWGCREGAGSGPEACEPSAAYVPPIFDYDSVNGTHSVTGGYVARDPGLPTLYGRYVYADFYDGVVRSQVPATPVAVDDRAAGLPTRPNSLVAFGEDACGHLYVVSLSGTVDRVQDGALGPASCAPTRHRCPRPRPPDRPGRSSPRSWTAPGRACGSRSRAAAASAAARRRGSP